MKLYVWYSPATSVTGRALAKSLGLTRTSPSSSDRGYGVRIPPTGTTHVICWGAREPQRWKEYRRRNLNRRTVLNNPFYTEKYKNKFHALGRMEQAGVSVPAATAFIYTIPDEFSLPVVGRKYYHYGGSQFEFIEDEMSLENSNSDYWMEYIDGEDKREYRLNVFRGRIVRAQRKKPREDWDGNIIEPRSYICKSHSNGWRFSLCDADRLHSSITENAIKAVEALGLDFGAVDVIRVPSTDVTVVLEVNTGVGLDNSGVAFYTNLFKEWLEQTRR